MTVPSFAPAAGLNLEATTASVATLLPTTGSPTIALVTNIGEEPVFVALGASTVTASVISAVVMPRASLALTIGSNTYIAVLALAEASGVNVALGT